MTQTQVTIMRTKLLFVKSQSDALVDLLHAFIGKEAEAIATLKENDFKSTAAINDRLDKVLSFLMRKYAETQSLTAAVDDASDLQSLHFTTSAMLSEPQTIIPSQVSGGSDVSKLTCRMEALEMAMSTNIREVEEKTALLLSIKDEQEIKIHTIGETLDSLVSFKLDCLDAKLQQMIINCSDKLNRHGSEIVNLEDRVQDIQAQCSGVPSLRHITTELSSRLYAVENVTNRFIKFT